MQRVFRMAGLTYTDDIVLTTPTLVNTEVTIPADAAVEQNHTLLLEVTDDDAMSLTSYQRVVVTSDKELESV